MKKQGKISVTTENIFPIIRQWLYSSQDIFIREIISNAADAITKRQHLANMGEVASFSGGEIQIKYDKAAKTLTISDNGIGMTADEIEKYINEIAYSGLVDFVEKYQKETDSNSQIIGHFGLGFYSAFMVADQVEIVSQSCQQGTEAVHWLSHEGIDFSMESSKREGVGTDIILHLSADAGQLYDEYTIRSTVKKYCQFLQYPIYLSVLGGEPGRDSDGAEQSPVQTAEGDQATEQSPAKELLNDPDPIWNKKPSELTDEDYLSFYRETFPGIDEPMFWVHLNLDYPFRLKGILYFPNVDLRYEKLEGRIKVYYNQVYVADNVPEIIPEFLFLLKGCIDCPDLPLNVSRSFLQDDQYVQKLSDHIVRKVADRLIKLSTDQPEKYEEYWPNLQLFVKYGMMRHPKFADRIYDIALLEKANGGYVRLADLKEGKIFYAPGKNKLSAYVDLAQKQGHDVYTLGEDIDIQWMSFLEYRSQGKFNFVRVDADDSKADESEIEKDERDNFDKLLAELGQAEYQVKYQKAGADSLPFLIREDEEYRRTKDLLKQIEATGDEKTIASFKEMLAKENRKPSLIVNTDRPILAKLANIDHDQGLRLIDYLLKLAKLGQGDLQGSDFIEFLGVSADYAFQSTEPTCSKD